MNKDMVENPDHYTHGGIECIDAIEAALGREGFIAFLRGQVIRYQWRLGHKGSAEQDAAKARWYAVKLEEVLAGRPSEHLEDDWLACDGGIISPVRISLDRPKKIDIKRRDGNILKGVDPRFFFWKHTGGCSDIVAYRESSVEK